MGHRLVAVVGGTGPSGDTRHPTTPGWRVAVLVVHVSCHLDPAGRPPEELLAAWPTLTDVAAAAQGEDVEITVLQAAERDLVVNHGGVACHFVAERPSRAPARLIGSPPAAVGRRLVEQTRRLGPAIVHFHGLRFPFQIRGFTAGLRQTPVLVQEHKDRVPRVWRRPIHRWGLRDVAGVAFTARRQADPFLAQRVLRPGVSLFEIVETSSRFAPGDRGAARTRTGLVGDPCLVWIGHLNANKDPLTVLEAVRRAVPHLRDPHLWCVYRHAPLYDSVMEHIHGDVAWSRRVHLIGERPHADIEHILRAADFLVLGSHEEGSGFAVIEALACGTVPLVTDIPSFRRLTADGTVGGLAPPGDPERFAQMIVAWANRKGRDMRTAARAWFERQLSFEALGRDLRSAYRSLRGGA